MAKRTEKDTKSKRNKVAKPTPAEDNSGERASAARVALLRNKLTAAMGDPNMRDQIVRAIRAMMTEEKS